MSRLQNGAWLSPCGTRVAPELSESHSPLCNVRRHKAFVSYAFQANFCTGRAVVFGTPLSSWSEQALGKLWHSLVSSISLSERHSHESLFITLSSLYLMPSAEASGPQGHVPPPHQQNLLLDCTGRGKMTKIPKYEGHLGVKERERFELKGCVLE